MLFDCSPQGALGMDPRSRCILQSGWQSLGTILKRKTCLIFNTCTVCSCRLLFTAQCACMWKPWKQIWQHKVHVILLKMHACDIVWSWMIYSFDISNFFLFSWTNWFCFIPKYSIKLISFKIRHCYMHLQKNHVYFDAVKFVFTVNFDANDLFAFKLISINGNDKWSIRDQ